MLFKCTLLLILLLFKCIESKIIEPCDNQFEIVHDLSQEDCGYGYVFRKQGHAVFGCFPQCVPHDPQEPCSEANPCPPGFMCRNNGKNMCILDPNSCITRVNYPTNPWKAAWKPLCLDDGTWAPKQCKGEATSGRCFCYDTVGNRIFGQAFIDKSENMTCACSRRKAEIRRQGSRPYSTLHCDSMGNYEPLQCDDGHCWCVQNKTGELISKVVPSSLMNLLPCYSKEDVGESYTRQCESEQWAQENLLLEFNLHGTKYVNFPQVICDADGNYGNYQRVGAEVYCKWKDNTNIGSYKTAIDSDIQNVNCYCARDLKIYESIGSTQYLECTPNGNYRPEQYLTNEKWYCVDKDGFKSSDFFSERPENCSDYI